MILNKDINVLIKERHKLLIMIDQERDEEKKLFYEEQLQAITKTIKEARHKMLEQKSLSDEVELK